MLLLMGIPIQIFLVTKTENSRGYNDFWKIKFSENQPDLTVKIFDRYGKHLGKDVPSSDYCFVVTRENGKEHKGHFSLKR